VTATHKLFAAAVLIAAGFGVAKLLGEPAATNPAPHAAAMPLPQLAALQTSGVPVAVPNATGGVRLVPDFGTTESSKTAIIPPLINVVPPLRPEENALNGRSLNADSLVTQQVPDAESQAAPWTTTPRAKLRNEAPRPLIAESRDSALPLSTDGAASSSLSPLDTTLNWRASDAARASFEQPAGPPATIVASYQEASDANAPITPVGPPPWPAPETAEGPRTHIVIDGDSLSRLAGRYLDDPRRSADIFEANRGVLADPELLPIGAELVIPSRTNQATAETRSSQSLLPRAVAIHASAGSGLVPVRPIPSAAATMPRAQLARPMPVE
jgi:hypothetical protein